jgi:hypothetical protein
MIQLRANMDRCVETFPLARFRDLLGVPPGAYERGANFAARVTDPAALEVNGLSDMGVKLTLARRSKFAPIDGVTLSWWKKAGDEFRAAMRERHMSKVGRMARLKGAVEGFVHRDAVALAGGAPQGDVDGTGGTDFGAGAMKPEIGCRQVARHCFDPSGVAADQPARDLLVNHGLDRPACEISQHVLAHVPPASWRHGYEARPSLLSSWHSRI